MSFQTYFLKCFLTSIIIALPEKNKSTFYDYFYFLINIQIPSDYVDFFGRNNKIRQSIFYFAENVCGIY